MESTGAAQGDPPALPWLPGRRAELAALTTLVRSAASGGRTLVVRGAPGTGKSALLHAARGLADDAGFLVLATSGAPARPCLPYAGLHEVLRPLLGSAGALPAAQRSALLTAFGETAGPAPQPFLVALGALGLLTEAAARRPVFVAVDDLPCLDEPSADAFCFVARRVGDDPVVLCATATTGADEQLLAARAEERLELRGLDRATAAEVLAVTGRALTAGERAEILAVAEGNPLALTELPRAWRRATATGREGAGSRPPLSVRLERVFAGRLDELARPVRDAVLVAAVGAGGAAAEILAGASVLAGAEVTAAALDRAEAAGLLHVENAGVRFRHPLVRSAVLGHEPRARQRAAHAALADVLGADPYRRAWHRAYVLDGPDGSEGRDGLDGLDAPHKLDDGVADELDAAHRIALARGSAVLAMRALERSAQLTSDPALRGRRLLSAAEHGVGLGRPDLVRPLLAAAARTGPDESGRARMAWLGAMCDDVTPVGGPGDGDAGGDGRWVGGGRVGSARFAAGNAGGNGVGDGGAEPNGGRVGFGGVDVGNLCAPAERSARAGDPSLAADLLLAAALRCRRAGAAAPMRERVAAAVAALKTPGCDPRLTAALALTQPLRQGASVRGELAGAAARNITGAEGVRLLAVAAQAVGDPVAAADFLDRAETLLREQGRLPELPPLLAAQVRAGLDLGDWHRAARAAEEGPRLAAEAGRPARTARSLMDDAEAAALHGDAAAALRLVDRADRAPHERGAELPVRAAVVRGVAAYADGHHAAAYDVLRGLFPEDDGDGSPAPDGGPPGPESFGALGFLADAAAHTGRRTEAAHVAAALARRTLGSPAPLLRVQLRYAAAVLSDDIEAECLFRRALADDLARWPWPRARAELAYGSWLRRQRRTAEARPLLRSARLTFDRIGARPWVVRADDELGAAGERRGSPGDHGEGRRATGAARGLSPQELGIARLAGQGLSDHEIGARLFLSPRTVGAHLGRVLRTLEVTSRGRLGTVLDASLG
ncbi:AAA family ATPase [Streptomyces sp. NPDC048416]|uniref:helix-turn-helix transcriptional regulator n=1 Tax=Streptomyces sp. NPDC048416 TaxID=3365546 RepID=UPI00371ADE76